MDRHLDSNGSAATPDVPVNVMGPNVYPKGGAAPSVPGPWWFHMMTESLRYVITAAGLTPDRADLMQLVEAIDLLISANAPTSIGRHTIWVPAAAITSQLTNGAGYATIETAVNKVIYNALTFDPAVTQYAQVDIQMPKGWNAGSLVLLPVWSHPAGAGDVVWGFQGLALSDGDAMDAPWSAAVTVTDASGAADTFFRAAETPALTLSGVAVKNDMAKLRIYRDATAGTDTLGVIARLHGFAVFYVTDAGTDA